ncbi:MAG: DUF2726 domain-containing protein [Verrucomicrobiota bacterium]
MGEIEENQKGGCLGILFRLLDGGPGDDKPSRVNELPYGKRDHFLSAAEVSFFHVLKSLVTSDQHVLCKVRLGDLLYVKRPNENRGARNKIDRKHVDFVVCHAKTMNPILVIELDDASHQRSSRRERDEFVDQAFAAAGIPILHVKAARSYHPKELSDQIRDILSGSTESGTAE